MGSGTDDTMPALLPSAAEVAEILKVLAHGEGMKKREAIRAHAAPLRALPCVEGARAAHQLDLEDWPEAVREATECLIANGGNYPGPSGKFLRRVLGLDGYVGSMTNRVDDFVATEPEWTQNRSSGGVDSQRMVMIEDLAGRLRSARNYPCESGDPVITNLAQMLTEWVNAQEQGLLHEEAALAAQQRALTAKRESFEELGRILERLFNAWRLGQPPSDIRAQIRVLLDRVVAPAYAQVIGQWEEFYPGHFLRGWKPVYLMLQHYRANTFVDVREFTLVAAILLHPKDSAWYTPDLITELTPNYGTQRDWVQVKFQAPVHDREEDTK